MTTAEFDPAGGPPVVEVRAGHAQPGSYTLLLWAAERNEVVFSARGNFINTDDDAWPLPGAVAEHDLRLVECIATVVVTPPLDQYEVGMVVVQDGHELAAVVQSGERPPVGAVTVDLFVRLEARRVPAAGGAP